MKRFFSISLIAVLFALTSCTTFKLITGLRVRLAKISIASISVTLPDTPAIAPGEKLPLVVRVMQSDGATQLTEGKGGGKVMWQDLQVTTTLVTVDKNGVISLRKNPQYSEGKLGHVTVTVPSHPGLMTELDVPVGYNYSFVCDFSGKQGIRGMDGSDGLPGMQGALGSIELGNSSPGGNGTSGTDASNGSDGGPGEDAPAVQVQLTLRYANPPLLQALVSAGDHKRRYLIDPNGGSLVVKADGGPGGEGGRGGSGGSGGTGGTGNPDGVSGANGANGHDGSLGVQGKGGMITLTYDPKVKPFLTSVHLSSQNGPAPELKEAPVARLW